jgi:transcriptional regulator with XRE-family HTH domain
MFAQNLAAARKARKLTISELARKSGVHRITLHRLETGRQQPRMATLAALADALSTDSSALLRAPRKLRRTG